MKRSTLAIVIVACALGDLANAWAEEPGSAQSKSPSTQSPEELLEEYEADSAKRREQEVIEQERDYEEELRLEAADAEAAARAELPAHTPLIKGGHYGAVVAAIDTPALVFAFTLGPGFLVGAGLGITYDGNGLPGPTGPTPDKWASSALVFGQYMIVNRARFAMGPELSFSASFAPDDAFTRKFIAPGWAFWYAPFDAPILIGGAWSAKISLVTGLETIADLGSLGLRFALLWN